MKMYRDLVDRIHLRTETMQTADRCFNLPRCAVTIFSPDAVKSSSISHKNCVLHSIAIPLYSSIVTLCISQSFYVHSLSIFVLRCLAPSFCRFVCKYISVWASCAMSDIQCGHLKNFKSLLKDWQPKLFIKIWPSILFCSKKLATIKLFHAILEPKTNNSHNVNRAAFCVTHYYCM